MAEDVVKGKCKVLVIGGSAGSLEVILRLLPELRTTLSLSIIIILHRKVSNDNMLSMLLSSKTKLSVKEAEEKEQVMPGTIYIAPADYHLLIEQDRTFSLDDSEKVNYSRPSIDITFESAAEVFGTELAGLLLSGANADGAQGLKTIQECGGTIAVQNPDDAEVSYMPQQAVNLVAIQHILNVKDIAAFINGLN